MPTTSEQMTHVIQELNKLTKLSTSQTHVCHYVLQEQYNKLKQGIEPLSELTDEGLSKSYHLAKQNLDSALKALKEKNQEKIQRIDFKHTCMQLIARDDLTNFNGLVDIGHYFGVGLGQTRMGIVDALYILYETFEKNVDLRIPSAKRCVDRLSVLLDEPKLVFPSTVLPELFQYPGRLHSSADKTQALKRIFAFDSTNELMVWMLGVARKDLEFALRLAASYAESPPTDCLMFLLLQTKDSNSDDMKIDLLAVAEDKPGQPSSKQTAFHRVVRSGNTLVAKMMLDEKFNPSNDLLRQLIAKDRLGKRPIDYIEEIKDIVGQSLMVKRVRDALETYKETPRYALTAADYESITEVLSTLDAQLSVALNINRHCPTL